MENSTFFTIAEPEVGYVNDNRLPQWIESESIATYNDDGRLIETKIIHYNVPDQLPSEVLSEYAITSVLCDGLDDVKECEGHCEDCKNDEKTAETGSEELEMLKLTPKGIAIVAAATSGLIKTIDDDRFETFWEYFEDSMKRHGYTCEV